MANLIAARNALATSLDQHSPMHLLMTRTRFTIASCALFALLGPLVGLTAYGLVLSSGKGWSFWQGNGVLMLLGYGYLFGTVQALFCGLLCSLGLLGAVQLWPSLAGDSRPWLRLLSAQLVGISVVLLLQGPALYVRSKNLLYGGAGFWTNLAKIWEFESTGGTMLLGLVSFLVWYLVPTVICASVVGWSLVPRLRR